MAKIEDLIQQIPDERLRKGIAAEVKALKKTKKFGLVFEEHLPETVRLPHLPVKPGELVAVKSESGNRLWRVKSIEKKIAVCDAAVEGYPSHKETNREFPVSGLVVVRSFGEPIYPALVPVDRVERGGPDKPWHLLINADNFHALQLLLYCYEGQVDVIYIDPPYNTGARDWKYNNDYVDATDAWRHSKWLSMMKKRLALAQRLLKPDGVLIVTVDDNELRHLWILIESIFLEKNIFPVTIQHNPGGTQGEQFSVTHEYALFVLAKSATIFPQDHLDGETYNLRRWGSTSGRFEAKNCFYPIYVKDGQIVKIGDIPPDDFSPEKQTVFKKDGLREVWPLDKNGIEKKWRWARNTISSVLNRAFVMETAERTEIKLRRESEKPKTVWTNTKYNAEAYGTDVISGILEKKFPYPKSLYAEYDCLLAAARGTKDALIVDFFAGSGTTLHAVNLLNASDDGKRRCVLVTNNEVSDEDEATLKEQGHQPGDDIWEKNGICESVTWPRTKLAILGKRYDGSPLAGHYVTSKIVSSSKPRNFKQIGFADKTFLNETAKRKQLAALINIPQSAMTENAPYIILPDYHIAVLFDEFAVDAWLSELEGQDAVTELYIVTSNEKYFRDIKIKASEKLGDISVLEPEKRPMADGFDENAEYYRLDFLDPDSVARGDAFAGILPILWMMAGCHGKREDSKGSQDWFIPKHAPFAVLIKEKEFRAFRKTLAERKDIGWIFLVTDSEDNFGLMRRALGRKFQCVQLYKSYLENFRLNTPEALGQGGAA